MDYSKLDFLMKIEKKADASKEKKTLFTNEMVKLMKEEGFTPKCETYLEKGISLDKGECLGKYMKELSPQKKGEFLNRILSSALFKKNTNIIGFKIGISLLGQTTNLFPKEYDIFEKLIKVLPGKANNKEKKFSGDAAKFFERYFVAVLKRPKELPDFNLLSGLNKRDMNDFYTMVHLCLTEMKPSTEVTKENMKVVKLWMDMQKKSYFPSEEKTVVINGRINGHNERFKVESPSAQPLSLRGIGKNPDETHNSEKSQEEKQAAMPNKKQEGKTEKDKKPEQTEKEKTPAQPFGRKELGNFANILKEGSEKLIATCDRIKELEESEKLLKSRNEELLMQLKRENDRVKMLTEKNNTLSKDLKDVKEGNQKMASELTEFKKTLTEKEGVIGELEEKIKKMEAVLSVHSRDKENSQNEQLNRIAAKIRPEYLDFKEVENEEMCVNLGENLRIQMQEIFKILEKMGVAIGGR